MRSKNGDKQCACAMMILTMFQEGNKLFQTGCWFNPKLPRLLIPSNGLAVSLIADWSLLLLIVSLIADQ